MVRLVRLQDYVQGSVLFHKSGGGISADVAGGVDDGGGTASVVPPLSNRGLAQTLRLWLYRGRRRSIV